MQKHADEGAAVHKLTQQEKLLQQQRVELVDVIRTSKQSWEAEARPTGRPCVLASFSDVRYMRGQAMRAVPAVHLACCQGRSCLFCGVQLAELQSELSKARRDCEVARASLLDEKRAASAKEMAVGTLEHELGAERRRAHDLSERLHAAAAVAAADKALAQELWVQLEAAKTMAESHKSALDFEKLKAQALREEVEALHEAKRCAFEAQLQAQEQARELEGRLREANAHVEERMYQAAEAVKQLELDTTEHERIRELKLHAAVSSEAAAKAEIEHLRSEVLQFTKELRELRDGKIKSEHDLIATRQALEAEQRLREQFALELRQIADAEELARDTVRFPSPPPVSAAAASSCARC
jgi:hypothetical protein